MAGSTTFSGKKPTSPRAVAELYIDANGGTPPGRLSASRPGLSALDVTWFEEPVSSKNLSGLAAIRRQIQPDVAAGEYSWTLADSVALISAGAVDCLQVSDHCAPNLHAHTWRPGYRTCGTSSTSTTTSGSKACSSTAPSTRRAARCTRTRTGRDTG